VRTGAAEEDRPAPVHPVQQQSGGQQSGGQLGSGIGVASLHIDGGRYIDQEIDVRQYMGVKLIQQIDAACCPSFADAPLSEEAAEVLAAALRIVADPTRLRLLSLIATRPGAEGCVCELTEPLGLSQPTVSHHLKVLTSAGILEREKRGRWVYYRIDREPLIALQAALGPGPLVDTPT
jgi:ArsR family transcriptional regulator